MSDIRDGVLILGQQKRCPGCDEALEHTGDKLYYCVSCYNFFIELDGTVQHYLLDPPETVRRRDRLVVTPTLA